MTAGFVLLSALCGVLMAGAFKVLSPRSLTAARRRLAAMTIGMVLHVSQPLSVIRLALSSIAAAAVLVLRLLPGLAAASIPFILFFGRLQAAYGHSLPDRPTVVVVNSAGAPPGSVAVEGGDLLDPVVRAPDQGVTAFRVVPGAGPAVTLVIDGARIPIVSARGGRTRVYSGFTSDPGPADLVFPSRAVVPGEGISARYGVEDRVFDPAGAAVRWDLALVLISSVSALLAGVLLFRIRM